MKKSELYSFIYDMKRNKVAEINSEIGEIKDKLIEEVLNKVGFEEFHKNWKEQEKKRADFVERLRENNLRTSFMQDVDNEYMGRVAYGHSGMDKQGIINSLHDDLQQNDEIREKKQLIEATKEEFNKLEQQVKLLSTAKKGYDLLIELGFNKEELDAYVQEKPNALVVQNFNNDLLGLNKG